MRTPRHTGSLRYEGGREAAPAEGDTETDTQSGGLEDEKKRMMMRRSPLVLEPP